MPSAGFQDYTATAVVQQKPGDPRPAFYLSQGPPNRNFIINSDGTSQFLGNKLQQPRRHLHRFQPAYAVRHELVRRRPDADGFHVADRVDVPRLSGVHLNTSSNINQLPSRYYNSTDFTLLNAVYEATQNYKPYTQFGTISYMTNAGHSTYHGFTRPRREALRAGRTDGQRALHLEQKPLWHRR